jgi:glycogen(starch) synthase
MRVALVHPHVLEDLGKFGMDVSAYSTHYGYEHRYAKLLNRHGHKADLIIFSRRLVEIKRLRHVWGHDIVIVPLGGPKILRHVMLIGRLARILRDYDIVHCFSYYSNIYDVLAPVCFLLRIPLVAQAQGIYPSIGGTMYVRKLFTLRLADRLAPLTRYEASFLTRRFRLDRSRTVVVPNFVVPEDYVFPDREHARVALKLGATDFVVLTVCRLVPEKGVQTLIRAASRLRDISELKVVVVGDGPYRGALEGLVKDLGLDGIVRFDGWVHGRQIGLYYSAADCFVLASVEESFGIVLLEALMYGLPVIASDTWGAREILGEKLPDFLFPVDDEVTLAEKIRRVYLDKEVGDVVGRMGREFVLERFSPERVYRRLMDVYSAVLGRNRDTRCVSHG